jgi:hypothetical protein
MEKPDLPCAGGGSARVFRVDVFGPVAEVAGGWGTGSDEAGGGVIRIVVGPGEAEDRLPLALPFDGTLELDISNNRMGTRTTNTPAPM